MNVSTATDNVTFISRIKVLHWTVRLALLSFANLGSMMLFKPKNMCHIDQVSEGKYSHWQCHFYCRDKSFTSNSDIGFTCLDCYGQHNAIWTQHICVTLIRVAKLSADTFNVTFYLGINVVQATVTLALLALADMGSTILCLTNIYVSHWPG